MYFNKSVCYLEIYIYHTYGYFLKILAQTTYTETGTLFVDKKHE